MSSRAANNTQRTIYFHAIDNMYIITHGFTKKIQKTPKREINHAKNLRQEYFSRNEGENNEG